jgi:hypothetical protein
MTMQVFSGSVKEGTIALDEDVALSDGTQVTVIADSPETRFETTPEEEAALLEAIGEADQGRLISAAELLSRLRR